ncbi:MAG: hypothetical protein Q7S73_01465 [bacterium]|nr:hypothetical protein [bacterium]
MKKNISKILSLLVATSVIYSPISFLFENKAALAQFSSNINSITDPNFVAFSNLSIPAIPKQSFEQTAINLNTYGTWIKELGTLATEAALEALRSAVLDQIVNQMIRWIQNGGKGSFVVDWDAYLKDAEQKAVGLFAQQLGKGVLCKPFNLQIQLALLPVTDFENKITCTLDDITENIENFYQDFQKGGWIAYQESWRPVNNFYGATLIALDELETKKADAKSAAQNEAMAGGGFLNFKKCDPDGTHCVTTTPGGIVGEAAKTVAIKTPIDRIIGAQRFATYVTAITNAAINQFVIKQGISWLQDLSKPPAKTTLSSPCAGLTGDAFIACSRLQIANNASNQNDKFSMLTQINTSLEPRQKAQEFITESLNLQNQLVNAIENCTTLPPNITDRSIEEATLAALNEEFDNNQSALDQLQTAVDNLSDPENTDSLLLASQFSNLQPILDGLAAEKLLTDAEAERDEIKTDVEAKLPSAQSSCP